MDEQADIIEPDPSRSDLRLLETAIRNDWKIPVEAFEEVPEKIIKIATGKNSKPRDRIAAARVLIEMKRQNERKRQPVKAKPQMLPVVLTEQQIELLRRSLPDRIRQLGHTGGTSSPGLDAPGTGGPATEPADE